MHHSQTRPGGGEFREFLIHGPFSGPLWQLFECESLADRSFLSDLPGLIAYFNESITPLLWAWGGPYRGIGTLAVFAFCCG